MESQRRDGTTTMKTMKMMMTTRMMRNQSS